MKLNQKQIDYLRRLVTDSLSDSGPTSVVACFFCGLEDENAAGYHIPIAPYLNPQQPDLGICFDEVRLIWACEDCSRLRGF